MPYTVDEFVADCRNSLIQDSGKRGQDDVYSHLLKLLADPADLLSRIGDNAAPGRYAIHHDPITDMYVFAHVYQDEGRSHAHDHGPCWIIYGNVSGRTDMIEWRRLDDGSQPGVAKLEKEKEYSVTAGEAAIFRNGAIHSTYHPAGPSMLVRVISGDMDSVWRHTFDPAKGTIKDRPPKEKTAATASH
jgi:hypothetical protein